MSQRLDVVFFGVSLLVLTALAGCSKNNSVTPVSTGLAELPIGTAIAVVTAQNILSVLDGDPIVAHAVNPEVFR